MQTGGKGWLVLVIQRTNTHIDSPPDPTQIYTPPPPPPTHLLLEWHQVGHGELGRIHELAAIADGDPLGGAWSIEAGVMVD